jgi:hypothetical protein
LTDCGARLEQVLQIGKPLSRGVPIRRSRHRQRSGVDPAFSAGELVRQQAVKAIVDDGQAELIDTGCIREPATRIGNRQQRHVFAGKRLDRSISVREQSSEVALRSRGACLQDEFDTSLSIEVSSAIRPGESLDAKLALVEHRFRMSRARIRAPRDQRQQKSYDIA